MFDLQNLTTSQTVTRTEPSLKTAKSHQFLREQMQCILHEVSLDLCWQETFPNV